MIELLEQDDLESLSELRTLALLDNDLRSLILDEDDFESLEELRGLFEDSNPDKISWIGDFEYELDSNEHPNLSIYRLNTKGSVYINTESGWKLLVKDGYNGKDGKQQGYLSGGGLGERDVKTLISQALSAYSPGTSGGSFTGTISANDVLVNTSSFTYISGTSAQDIFEQIDRKISTKLLLGEYLTNDIVELSNSTSDIYVGKSTSDGRWYLRRVRTISSEEMEVRHANISNNPSVLTYESALNSYATLDYRLLNELTF